MCTTVVTLDGHWVSGVGEMAARGWPVTEADVCDAEHWAELQEHPNQCLCSVDVEAILDRHGVHYVVDIPGFLDIVPGPPPETPE